MFKLFLEKFPFKHGLLNSVVKLHINMYDMFVMQSYPRRIILYNHRADAVPIYCWLLDPPFITSLLNSIKNDIQ